MSDFYDRLAPLFHLIFRDFDASIERQAQQVSAIIHARWGTGASSILDVSCGIGTQSIGLARRGFAVTGSDLSPGAIERARLEALRRAPPSHFPFVTCARPTTIMAASSTSSSPATTPSPTS